MEHKLITFMTNLNKKIDSYSKFVSFITKIKNNIMVVYMGDQLM